MDSRTPPDSFRRLPSVRALADAPELAGERARYGRPAVVHAARVAIETARRELQGGRPSEPDPTRVRHLLDAQAAPRLQRVINATGVVVHTNLGRSPLAPAARAAMLEAAGYTDLELRLDTGERGGRDDGVNERIRALTGAEQAFAVNNGAAAALLMLAGTAAGREVIVSRGELVEIGGGFRVPEVLTQSGCRLVEVGTTNRTRISDYERAITPQTGALLKVHPSNFRITGFTEEVSLEALSELGRRTSHPVLFDQGAGDLAALRAAIQAGGDVVTCSGDKLLGGPQAGLVLGKAAHVERLRKHPLARALRIDKLTLAALEATLALWQFGREHEIPIAAMLATPRDVLRQRAEKLAALVPGSTVVESAATTGGGARPDEPVASYAVRLASPQAVEMARLLRTGAPPIVPRIEDGAVLLDVLTLADEELPLVADAVAAATAA